MNTIKGRWDFFAAKCLPKNASAIQIQEMKKAFYCGASSILEINFFIGGMISEEEALEVLTGLNEEFKKFMEEEIKKRESLE